MLRDKIIYNITASSDNDNPSYQMELIEIGAVKIRDGKEVDEFYRLVKTSEPIPLRTTEVTGITNEVLDEAIPFSQVIDEFLSFVYDCDLYASSIFERAFLVTEIERKISNSSIKQAAITSNFLTLSEILKPISNLKYIRYAKNLAGDYNPQDALNRARVHAKVYIAIQREYNTVFLSKFSCERLQEITSELSTLHKNYKVLPLYKGGLTHIKINGQRRTSDVISVTEFFQIWGKTMIIDYRVNGERYMTRDEVNFVDRMICKEEERL